jgi:hypothetical protein
MRSVTVGHTRFLKPVSRANFATKEIFPNPPVVNMRECAGFCLRRALFLEYIHIFASRCLNPVIVIRLIFLAVIQLGCHSDGFVVSSCASKLQACRERPHEKKSRKCLVLSRAYHHGQYTHNSVLLTLVTYSHALLLLKI